MPLEVVNGDLFDESYGLQWILFKYTIAVVFLADIIIKFNTGLFEKGTIIFSKKEIAIYYVKNGLIIDLISFICVFQTVYKFDFTRVLNLLILFKIQTAR